MDLLIVYYHPLLVLYLFIGVEIMKKTKRQQLTHRIYKQVHRRKNEKMDIR